MRSGSASLRKVPLRLRALHINVGGSRRCQRIEHFRLRQVFGIQKSLPGRFPVQYLPECSRFLLWLFPLPAVFALVGWMGVFITPGLQPGGWKYMVYAFGTILAGSAAYLILGWHKREWPFAPSQPEAPTGPALEPGELSERRVQMGVLIHFESRTTRYARQDWIGRFCLLQIPHHFSGRP